MGVVKALKRAGVYKANPVGAAKGSVPGNFGKSKYKVNTKVFDDLSPEACYWLGFLLADGSVVETKGNKQTVVSLELMSEDKPHVEKFRDFLQTTFPINTIKPHDCMGYMNSGSAYLRVRSTQLAYKLSQYNIVPRKSDIAKAPEELLGSADFWRGIIDGDGCVGLKDGKYPYIKLVGTKELCEQFCAFTQDIIAHDRVPTHSKKLLWYFSINGGGTAERVLKHLYGGASIYLDRKYEKLSSILEK